MTTTNEDKLKYFQHLISLQPICHLQLHQLYSSKHLHQSQPLQATLFSRSMLFFKIHVVATKMQTAKMQTAKIQTAKVQTVKMRIAKTAADEEDSSAGPRGKVAKVLDVWDMLAKFTRTTSLAVDTQRDRMTPRT